MKDIHKKNSLGAPETKSETARREEEILQFWKAEKIFERSLQKEAPKGEFVFYDGPPFATGLPHYGSLLSSIIKDVIPRYKTMRGFHVRRRWGWDCHGLPIENIVEKQLSLKTKKDILALGIAAFNQAARKTVLQYAQDWEKYIDRIGRWVDFKNSYKTMDNSYIESVWWALKQIHDKGLLYEGRKVLLYCPRCETPLAKAEIAMDNSYQEITEEAVTVKFKVKPRQKIGDVETDDNTYILAWTTTPWTLPGNVALAVGEEIDYIISGPHPIEDGCEEYWIVANEIYEKPGSGFPPKAGREHPQKGFPRLPKHIQGKELIGLEYEPLYTIEKVTAANKQNTHTVLTADFVTIDEGTGIVHTAVIYGEDDYNLGIKEDLPMVPLLDASGKFNDDAPEFVRGIYIKDAEKNIKDDLRKRELLFEAKNHTHSYPHCYRCGTPLIYNALSSWFINIEKVKERMQELNKEINWFPEHLKFGRFGNILESAPDWTISRNRFWASPLPIWKNEKTGAVKVIGSLEELKQRTNKSGNRYFIMRHGEAENNILHITSAKPSTLHHLTTDGEKQVEKSLEEFTGGKIDLIMHSPLVRTTETARLAAEHFRVPEQNVLVSDLIRELDTGEYDGKPVSEYEERYPNSIEQFERVPRGGENFTNVKKRVGKFLYDLESQYSHKNILIISHGDPTWMLQAVAVGASREHTLELLNTSYLQTAEIREVYFTPLPHNAEYELDLHRPYIDDLSLVDEDGASLVRISEVVDCWVESGSMPFAEYHYLFENKNEFEKRAPGDFIAEYIAQTRTWFYYMHAVSVLLFDRISFRNVVTTGTVLAADGSKMSKSKGNYTDPLENLDQYGADALRFYLMTSSVMQAEDLNFRNEDLREAHNRVVNMLWNSYKFYELYVDERQETSKGASSHVLDQWIEARLKQTVGKYTEYFESFDTIRAGHVLREFIDDLSTWYIRRSRERFREEEHGSAALATLRAVLGVLSKITAPLMPFIAESIYRGIGSEGMSVHLSDWPETQSVSIEEAALIAVMDEVRRMVSLALEQRAAVGIKVRQPIGWISIVGASQVFLKHPLRTDLEKLLCDEVNVETLRFADGVSLGVSFNPQDLDFMTDGLRRKGQLREFMRHIQDLRKKEGLAPRDMISLTIETDAQGREFLEKFLPVIKKTTGLTSVDFFNLSSGEEIVIDDLRFTAHFSLKS